MEDNRSRSVDPARWAKVVRRLVLPVMVLCVVALWMSFGWVTVASSLDTLIGTQTEDGRSFLPVPPGSECLIDKWSSSAQVGSAVFFEHEGSVLLSRVVALRDDGMVVRNDNSRSEVPDSDDFGVVPMKAHVGTVLTVFPPNADGK